MFWHKAATEAEMGAVLYFSALHAEKTRHEMFQKQEFPTAGSAFASRDTERQAVQVASAMPIPRSAPRLGVVCRRRLPVDSVRAHRFRANRSRPSLRDTLWAPAFVLTGPAFKGTDIGQVMIPASTLLVEIRRRVRLARPRHRMGSGRRRQRIPGGQKMFIVDGEEVPLLEIRSLEFASDATA